VRHPAIFSPLLAMARTDWNDDDDEQLIVIEDRDSSGISAFLLGAAIGAGLALILAPHSGAETRQRIRRNAEKAGAATKRAGAKVSDALAQAKADLESRIDSARSALDLKKTQVSRAMDAGRAAAQTAREDLERRLAEQRTTDTARTQDDHES
jgi:gas vesicle protein